MLLPSMRRRSARLCAEAMAYAAPTGSAARMKQGSQARAQIVSQSVQPRIRMWRRPRVSASNLGESSMTVPARQPAARIASNAHDAGVPASGMDEGGISVSQGILLWTA